MNSRSDKWLDQYSVDSGARELFLMLTPEQQETIRRQGGLGANAPSKMLVSRIHKKYGWVRDDTTHSQEVWFSPSQEVWFSHCVLIPRRLRRTRRSGRVARRGILVALLQVPRSLKQPQTRMSAGRERMHGVPIDMKRRLRLLDLSTIASGVASLKFGVQEASAFALVSQRRDPHNAYGILACTSRDIRWNLRAPLSAGPP